MSIEEIKKALYKAYEIDEEYDDQTKGCYINDKWLSIKNIILILEKEVKK